MARGVIDMKGLNRDDLRQLRATPVAEVPFSLDSISHVVIKVADLERSVKFYAGVLGFSISDAYPETMMPGRMVFMRYNDEHHGLALVGGRKEDQRGDLHHFAFQVKTLDALLRARDHLKKHNVKIDFEGRRRAGCQLAVEFMDPDNHHLEICWGMDRVSPGALGRPPEEWRECFSLEDAIANPPPGQDTTLRR
ncbi:MAG: VOC family protein [Deltaproteobacteria bacterium]|nr:VOC family protein [Deltaproteobacteria bacterium]